MSATAHLKRRHTDLVAAENFPTLAAGQGHSPHAGVFPARPS